MLKQSFSLRPPLEESSMETAQGRFFCNFIFQQNLKSKSFSLWPLLEGSRKETGLAGPQGRLCQLFFSFISLLFRTSFTFNILCHCPDLHPFMLLLFLSRTALFIALVEDAHEASLQPAKKKRRLAEEEKVVTAKDRRKVRLYLACL